MNNTNETNKCEIKNSNKQQICNNKKMYKQRDKTKKKTNSIMIDTKQNAKLQTNNEITNKQKISKHR